MDKTINLTFLTENIENPFGIHEEKNCDKAYNPQELEEDGNKFTSFLMKEETSLSDIDPTKDNIELHETQNNNYQYIPKLNDNSLVKLEKIFINNSNIHQNNINLNLNMKNFDKTEKQESDIIVNNNQTKSYEISTLKSHKLNDNNTSTIKKINNSQEENIYLNDKNNSSDNAQNIQRNNNKDINTIGDAILTSLIREKNIVNKESINYQKKSIEINEIVEKIVDKILVSTENSSGTNEIRIKIKQEILLDTEIQIIKKDDFVHINFITQSDESINILNSNMDTLLDMLDNNLVHNVIVFINEQQYQNEQYKEGSKRNKYKNFELEDEE